MKKIAIVHNLPSGGGKRALHEYTRRLKQHGYALDLYNLSLTDESFLSLLPYVNQIISNEIKAFHLIQTRYLPFVIQYVNLPRRIRYLHRLELLYRSIARQIDRQDYDLVFVQHCQVLQSPYILRYLRTPSVYYCAEPPRRLYEPAIIRPAFVTLKQKIQESWYRPANFLYQRKTRRDDYVNARSATLVLTNSFFSRESIYRVYGINARVNYLGVDHEKFVPPANSARQRDRIVLSVGRTYPEKGYDFMIEALSYLPQAIRPKLVVVADMRDPVEERYLSLLAQQKKVEYTIFSGISDEALVRWYQRATLFVYAPILEPFGFAPLEAMACGLPVVAVKEGGVRESVLDGQTGFLTQRDPQEFAEKIQFFLENPAMRREYGKQARQHVESNWTWEKSYEQLITHFESVGR